MAKTGLTVAFPIPGGKLSVLVIWYDVSCGFFTDAVYHAEEAPSVPFIEGFCNEGVLGFCQVLCPHQLTLWFLPFVLFMYEVHRTDRFSPVEPRFHSWAMTYGCSEMCWVQSATIW